MTPNEADRTFLAGLTVLYVEDDSLIRNMTTEYLRRWVGRLCLAQDGEEGLASFRRDRPDLIITDILMPKLDGLAMLEAIRAEAPAIPVVLTTAFEQIPFLVRAINLGVDRYVLKPIQPDQLQAALLHAAHHLRAEVELRKHIHVEQELMMARHHESMSLLAKGMAHDYNNLLQAILSSVHAAAGHTNPGSPAHLILGMTQRFTATAQQLSQELLVLSREMDQPDQESSPIPLLEAALAPLGGTGIQVTLEVPDRMPVVNFNPKRLSQALQILLSNAQEAMPRGGTLKVTVAARPVGPDAVSLGLSPGTYLCLRFQDSGPGIDGDHLPRIFDPYYSTKSVGNHKGQGLGLAVCRSIMRAHRGQVSAESVVGEGSTFSLFLPVIQPWDA